MIIRRLQLAPTRAASGSCAATAAATLSSLTAGAATRPHAHPPTSSFALILPHILSRAASHNTERAANRKKNGPGKRLGAKKGSGEYVVPGNILIRQRGTRWHAGENVFMGRDHTLHAAQPGYVRFYRDPAGSHPDRKFIGVALAREHVLPTPPHMPRRRRLGMVAVPRRAAVVDESVEGGADGQTEVSTTVPSPLPPSQQKSQPQRKSSSRPLTPAAAIAAAARDRPTPRLRPGGMYRVGNWEIGRAAERAGVTVHRHRRKDRFCAWRKASARKARTAEQRGLRGAARKAGKSKGGKAKGKGGKGGGSRGK